MTNRAGRRARHRRHKASTKRNRAFRLALLRMLFEPRPEKTVVDCGVLFHGGPLDGQQKFTKELYWPVFEFHPLSIHDLAGPVDRLPEGMMKHINYVRTRRYCLEPRRENTRFIMWVMQPDTDEELSSDSTCWPSHVRNQCIDILYGGARQYHD